MIDKQHEDIAGKMELSHEPVPPCRTVFFITITLGALYLVWILLSTL